MPLLQVSESLIGRKNNKRLPRALATFFPITGLIIKLRGKKYTNEIIISPEIGKIL